MDKQLEAVSDSISLKGILEGAVEEWRVGGGLSRERQPYDFVRFEKAHSRKGLLWEKDSLGRIVLAEGSFSGDSRDPKDCQDSRDQRCIAT